MANIPAGTNTHFNYLKDPTFGSPEYDSEERPPAQAKKAGTLIASINFAPATDLLANIGTATESFLDAGSDLARMILVNPAPEKPSEEQPVKALPVQEMPIHPTPEPTMAIMGDKPVSVEDLQKLFGIRISREHVEKTGELKSYLQTDGARKESEIQKDKEKKAQEATSFSIAQGRADKIQGQLRQDKIAEGGLLSTTGGAGAG